MDAQRFRAQFLDGLAAGQLFALFDLQPEVSFFLKDRKGRFVALNRRGREYCGVATEEEAIGKTDFDFFPADRAAAYHADDEAVMKTGQPVSNRIEASPESIRSPRLVITDKIPVRNTNGIPREQVSIPTNTTAGARFTFSSSPSWRACAARCLR